MIQGDLICSIETDKATVDFEINEEGYLAKMVYPAGSKDIPVGAVVAIIVDEKADVEAFKDYAPEVKTEEVAKTQQQAVKRQAVLDYEQTNPPNQPILTKSVPPPILEHNPDNVQSQSQTQSQKVKPSSTPIPSNPSENYEDLPVSNVRKIIAERLLLSKNTIPHFYVEIDCVMDKTIK